MLLFLLGGSICGFLIYFEIANSPKKFYDFMIGTIVVGIICTVIALLFILK